MGKDLPLRRFIPVFLARLRLDPLGVDGDDDALHAEALPGLVHEIGIEHGGGVDRNLVGAGRKQGAHVGRGAHAAAHGERNIDLARHRFHRLEQGRALVGAGGDVEEHQFVGALLVVAARHFHRVAGVAQLLELDALDHAAGVDVETGDDALGKHGETSL